MIIYEDDRIKVSEIYGKVRIYNKFTFDTFMIDRPTFEKMCESVMKQSESLKKEK